ncbi:D-isomer specific 2-hydroxyacid dehydrogenase [Plectosphaerella cucumerina]|uniref:D-isomer specific 2-hydroxyacid dehydrogenase n=1 Tax=Plectosphaerella cucumerina TaxID=40658 RepID=A0A8K0X5Z2_9PEZI|nr:D-isomer specific 2-hydroxyacid dehydrogenase [Plectosphaerella cucumerina]
MARNILMVGTIFHAHDEFASLSALTSVKRFSNENSRAEFIRNLDTGLYDDVLVISRTFDSVTMTGPFDAEMISHLPNSVRFICHNGAGFDQIDIAACTARGIGVSTTPGAVNAGTANVAIYLILSALRTTWIPESELRAGRWRGATPLGRDPDSMTLGILGMGGIGRTTAKRAVAFGFKIQYSNEFPVKCLKEELGVDYEPAYVTTAELLRTSDVISIHVPLLPSTRGLINDKTIATMKKGVVIVNTARGPIIDEAALVRSLDSGKISSVGLDVFEKEPAILPGLLNNPRAVLLPHIGTMTVDTQKKMEVLVIDNVKSALSHGKLLTKVPDVGTPPISKL